MKLGYLTILILGFFSGIFFHSFFDLGVSFSLTVLVVGVSVSLVEIISRKQKLFFVSIFLLALSVGLLRYDLENLKGPSEALFYFNNKQILSEGVIVRVDETQFKDRIIIEQKKIIFNDQETSDSSKILIEVNKSPEYEYGDTVIVRGMIRKIENKKSDGENNTFDRVVYFGRDEIYFEITKPKVELVSKDNGSFVKEKLFDLKNVFLSKISSQLREPESSLLSGIILGYQGGFDKELSDAFKITSTSHIVVLSGYNISLIGGMVARVFSFLPRTGGLLASGFAVISLVVMAGGGASVVRAGIMSFSIMFARLLGRPYEALRILLITGFIMVAIDPKILAFDYSFELSFMATLGIIIFPPLIEKYFYFVTEKFALREIIVTTISAEVFVMPIILHMSGVFPLFSLPANILVLSVLPFVMTFGALYLFFSFLSSSVSFIFSSVSYLFLSYQINVVKFIADLPMAALSVGNFNALSVLLYYVVIFYICYIFMKHEEKTKEDKNINGNYSK